LIGSLCAHGVPEEHCEVCVDRPAIEAEIRFIQAAKPSAKGNWDYYPTLNGSHLKAGIFTAFVQHGADNLDNVCWRVRVRPSAQPIAEGVASSVETAKQAVESLLAAWLDEARRSM
jgi:hypothetical protein